MDLSKKFWRPTSLVKDTNDRHSFNLAPNFWSPSICDWHNHFILKVRLWKTMQRTFDSLLLFHKKYQKKITYCTKNFIVSNLAVRLQTGWFGTFQGLFLLIPCRTQLFFFLKYPEKKIMLYKWLRRFHHSFLRDGLF